METGRAHMLCTRPGFVVARVLALAVDVCRELGSHRRWSCRRLAAVVVREEVDAVLLVLALLPGVVRQGDRRHDGDRCSVAVVPGLDARGCADDLLELERPPVGRVALVQEMCRRTNDSFSRSAVPSLDRLAARDVAVVAFPGLLAEASFGEDVRLQTVAVRPVTHLHPGGEDDDVQLGVLGHDEAASRAVPGEEEVERRLDRVVAHLCRQELGIHVGHGIFPSRLISRSL